MHKSLHVPSGEFVAIKVMTVREDQSEDDMLKEINIMKDLHHSRIVEVFDVIHLDSFIYIVMEYLSEGSLLSYIRERKTISEEEAKKFFSQICSAVEYLHECCHIAHRDLKLENILLDQQMNIRLTDFGLSCYFDSTQMMKTRCGTPSCVAPEVIKGLKYTCKCDIWSLGILLYTMVEGKRPFVDKNTKLQMIKILHLAPAFSENLSSDLKNLISKLLEKDPNQRLTFSEIKSHDWFADNPSIFEKSSAINYMRFKKFSVTELSSRKLEVHKQDSGTILSIPKSNSFQKLILTKRTSNSEKITPLFPSLNIKTRRFQNKSDAENPFLLSFLPNLM